MKLYHIFFLLQWHKYSFFLQDVSWEFLTSDEDVMFCHYGFRQQLIKKKKERTWLQQFVIINNSLLSPSRVFFIMHTHCTKLAIWNIWYHKCSVTFIWLQIVYMTHNFCSTNTNDPHFQQQLLSTEVIIIICTIPLQNSCVGKALREHKQVCKLQHVL